MCVQLEVEIVCDSMVKHSGACIIPVHQFPTISQWKPVRVGSGDKVQRTNDRYGGEKFRLLLTCLIFCVVVMGTDKLRICRLRSTCRGRLPRD